MTFPRLVRRFFQGTLMGIVSTASLMLPHDAAADVTYSPPPRNQALYFAAVDALGMRAYGYAELVRAKGEAAVSYAAARNLHAEAYHKELDNYVQEVRAYWTRRAIGQEQLLKLKYDPIKAEKRRNSKQWELLQLHPGISRADVVNGKVLNWLLVRMSDNLLDYSFSPSYVSGADQNNPDLRLSREVLHHLRLKQKRVGPNEMAFHADEGIPLSLDWWPWVLRSGKFEPSRNAILGQREELQRAAMNGHPTERSLVELEKTVVAMKERLRATWSVQRVPSEWLRYKEAYNFVDSRYNEIRAMQDLGDPQMFDGNFGYNSNREGDDLISLLRFMWRKGLEFAPATPGDEPVYQEIFGMMRGLYKKVADTDPDIQDDPTYGILTPSKF